MNTSRIRRAAFAVAVIGGTLTIALPAGTAVANTADGNVALTVLSPTPGQVITGPQLPLQVLASGYRIDARYAGTPNSPGIGHYHEILDGNLVDMTPYRDGNPDSIPTVGVTPGQHTPTIVPSHNDHSMIMSA